MYQSSIAVNRLIKSRGEKSDGLVQKWKVANIADLVHDMQI